MKQSNTISLTGFLVKTCGVAFFILLALSVSAQTRGTVTEVKDPRIDSVIAKRIELSKQPNSPIAQNSGNGFRVQIFMGSNRTDAYNAQAKFNNLYPDIKTYLQYVEPNFKVKAGDFKTRLDASRLMEQLRKQFTSLIILSEKINLPKTDSND
ncbi:preprotein translocase [Mucilaginibacter sp. PPCGB 2223]|uniref:SPOR domain-containing protein n=1 Tax=Mucilaginibacter sp. PPCGB 2223 TaxID=1886027 RepID=UPI0008249303|nr:SPOR domain-containing protein [Mucilaginibacter sp. PPCGB 2223]OCX50346.1 preprotein translocase [Mucilaginibacter sp. PPCGB 2223]